MYIVEVENNGKWKAEPIQFAEIEDASEYAFKVVLDKKADNAKVVDERYRKNDGKRID